MRTWPIVAAVGTGVIVGVSTALVARRVLARAAIIPTYAPGEPPLRPPPPDEPIPGAPSVPDGPPGPLATELSALIDAQSDAELAHTRAILPAGWWSYVLAATRAPTDDAFRLVLNPTIVDVEMMSDEEKDELEDNLVEALGLMDALRLRSIMSRAGAVS
jgi:hypothetical protein